MKREDLFSTDQGDKYEPTAANLTDEFSIVDPAEYIVRFRKTFLKWARKQKGVSIGDAARACNIDQKNMERIESGNVSDSDLMYLQKIANFYGTSYPYLLSLFKLARRPQDFSEMKLAAYNPAEAGSDVEEKIVDFIKKLKEEK